MSSRLKDEDLEGVLTKEEENRLFEMFNSFDKDCSGYIDSAELRIVLETMDQFPSEDELFKMISVVDEHNTGHVGFAQFKKVIARQKKKQMQSKDEDALEAFIAMGGNKDRSGLVNLDFLVKTIQEDFGLEIDIKKLIKDIDTDSSGEIDFFEFKSLLQLK